MSDFHTCVCHSHLGMLWDTDTLTDDGYCAISLTRESEYLTIIDGHLIWVDKRGGGLPGREYEGDWIITVQRGREVLFDREVLHTGTPKTHKRAAKIAYDFATEGSDV